jgi:hypothetical protein
MAIHHTVSNSYGFYTRADNIASTKTHPTVSSHYGFFTGADINIQQQNFPLKEPVESYDANNNIISNAQPNCSAGYIY